MYICIPRNVCQDVAMKSHNELLGSTIHRLAICYQQLSGRFNRVLEPLGLNMTQMSLLTHFSWQPETAETISHLAESMKMNQPAVTKAVKAMVMAALLRREKDESDARVTHLYITEQGLARLMEARVRCLPILHQAFKGLEPEELALLNTLLEVPVAALVASE